MVKPKKIEIERSSNMVKNHTVNNLYLYLKLHCLRQILIFKTYALNIKNCWLKHWDIRASNEALNISIIYVQCTLHIGTLYPDRRWFKTRSSEFLDAWIHILREARKSEILGPYWTEHKMIYFFCNVDWVHLVDFRWLLKISMDSFILEQYCCDITLNGSRIRDVISKTADTNFHCIEIWFADHFQIIETLAHCRFQHFPAANLNAKTTTR